MGLRYPTTREKDLGQGDSDLHEFLFGDKGPPGFFAHEKDLGQGARIFTKLFFSSFYTY